MKPDKGVVILNAINYKQKMYDILNDKKNLQNVLTIYQRREKLP